MKTENLPLTAEAVAFMRANSGDNFSKHLVTKRIERIFWVFQHTSPKLLNRIIQTRMNLSKIIETEINRSKATQIIELAAGYSTLGLTNSQKNKNQIYIELDLPEVIDKKKSLITNILNEENLHPTKNHKLLSVNLVKEKSLAKLKPHLSKNKRTLIFSEGFNPYLSAEEHENLTDNIKSILDYVGGGIYILQDALPKGRQEMFSGKLGKLLHIAFRRKTGSSKKTHFSNAEECKEFLSKKGFRKIKVLSEKEFLVVKCRR